MKHFQCILLVITTIFVESLMGNLTHHHIDIEDTDFKALGTSCSERYWKEFAEPAFELLRELQSLENSKSDPELSRKYEISNQKLYQWRRINDPTGLGQKFVCNSDYKLQCEKDVCVCRTAKPPHKFILHNNTCLAALGSSCNDNNECFNPKPNDPHECFESKCGGFEAFETSIKLQESDPDIGITNIISVVVIALSILLNLALL